MIVGLRLYNTLGRRVEPFEPIEPGRVRMYTCGPTVYDRAHIGNFRTFVWEDLLRRWLRVSGYEVEQVMNVTDVDDKTIRAAAERGVPLEDVTRPVELQFLEDWETLGLEDVEYRPRATEHVDGMIELIRRLEDAGVTYDRDGSLYYAIGSFDDYGRLVDLDPEALRSAGRAAGDEEYSKDDPRDFVLWKGGAREEEGGVAVWDSPWGPGRPGWHLECSAMAMEYLGETLDIHTGGVDNIFPHHVNEMAQSEAATGRPFARYWLHAAHLLVDGGKMSKSLGNFHTLGSLLEGGARPSAIRYLLLSAHYRSQLNFTLDGLEGADRAITRLWEFRTRLEAEALPEDPPGAEKAARALVAAWRDRFDESMNDDLAVSGALAATFDLVRDGNAALDAGEVGPDAAAALRGALDRFDAVFGVLALRAREEEIDDPEFAAWVEERIEARARARSERDFGRADALREELEQRGVVLEDTASGTRWKLASGPPIRDPAATADRS